MLDHADRQLARLIAFLEQTDMLANTIVIVTSDNGASQEGGPLGFVNSAGPRNFRTEPFSEKLGGRPLAAPPWSDDPAIPL